MLTASFKKYTLNFDKPSGTSRGILYSKETWFIVLRKDNQWGIGECGMLRGLSIDDRPDFEAKLNWVCDHISLGVTELYQRLLDFPSIQFGLEIAFNSLESEKPFELFPSAFTRGEKSIPINGLIWMGDKVFMKNQIAQKLKQGFSCIKMKIGAIDFTTEVELLKNIRDEFSASEIELRVDANGAFLPNNAIERLKVLSELDLHSIEQPLKQGQWQEMAWLCEHSPVPIALDEELIGVISENKKRALLNTIKPQFVIIKPSLVGGFQGSDSWILNSVDLGIEWWITSALESNIGLSAISQFTFTKNSKLPQGLGTGSLYKNNLPSPLEVMNGSLAYNPNGCWELDELNLAI